MNTQQEIDYLILRYKNTLDDKVLSHIRVLSRLFNISVVKGKHTRKIYQSKINNNENT